MQGLSRRDGWRGGPGVIALLTGVGIVTGLGVTRAAGCDLSLFPWVLTLPFAAQPPWRNAGLNVFLSAALLTLAISSVATTRPTALRLMILELLGFVFFLFLFRGGYAVGYGGTPLWEVVQFDLVSAGCRGGVLAVLASGENASRRRQICLAAAGALCGIALVGVKLLEVTGPFL